MMRTLAACLALAALTAGAQIDAPPAFDDRPAFRKSAAGPLDSSSHISGRAEASAARLAESIDRFAPPPTTAAASERELFTAARTLLRDGHTAAAAASFEQSAARHPESDALLAGAAITRFLAGHYDPSADAILELVRRSPRDARWIVLLGETAPALTPARRKSYESSLRRFAAAYLALGEPRYYLAQLLALGQPAAPPESVALWKQAAQLDPRDARPCLELARVYAEAQPVAAIAWLQRAIERQPDLPDAHFRLSRLYTRRGDPARAARHLERYKQLRAAGQP
jgi:tetratricopeptide (TPR) repeat protein